MIRELIARVLTDYSVINRPENAHLKSKVLLTLEHFLVDGKPLHITATSAFALVKSGKKVTLVNQTKKVQTPRIVVEPVAVKEEPIVAAVAENTVPVEVKEVVETPEKTPAEEEKVVETPVLEVKTFSNTKSKKSNGIGSRN